MLWKEMKNSEAKIFSEAKAWGGRYGNRNVVSAAILGGLPPLPPVRTGTEEVEEGECPSEEPSRCSRILQRERRRAPCAPPHPPAGAAKQQPGGAVPG